MKGVIRYDMRELIRPGVANSQLETMLFKPLFQQMLRCAAAFKPSFNDYSV